MTYYPSQLPPPPPPPPFFQPQRISSKPQKPSVSIYIYIQIPPQQPLRNSYITSRLFSAFHRTAATFDRDSKYPLSPYLPTTRDRKNSPYLLLPLLIHPRPKSRKNLVSRARRRRYLTTTSTQSIKPSLSLSLL